MEAILIAEENASEMQKALDSETDYLEMDIFVRNPKNWYLIRDYVDVRGHNMGTRVLPEVVLTRFYVFDPDDAKSDWCTIFRQTPEQTLPYKDSE